MTADNLTGAGFINGAWVRGAGFEMQSHNPATGRIVWSGPMADQATCDLAVAAAAAAAPGWAATPAAERIALVRAFAALVETRRQDLAALISAETGKMLWDAAGETASIIGKATLSVRALEERTPTRETPAGGATLRVSHRPHGVMLVLGPFNFPGHLPNGHIMPALAAGNTIVFKPSELTPGVGEFMVRLWQQAGAPPGVINLVQGGRETAQALVSHDRIDGVLFTGGVAAGLAIHKALAGQPQKIVALELGGNNPLVVWDAEDPDIAADVIVRSAFLSSGQRCTCARRLILPEGGEGDAVIAALLKLVDRLIVGAPGDDPEPFVGPLISARAAEAVLAAQASLVAAGARSLRDCRPLLRGPNFITPGVLDVTGVAERPDEEVFGPLLQVIRVASFEDALREANNTRFGLAAALVSRDAALFEQFAARVRAGVVNWNRQTTGASGAAPFGGVGLSGNHRPAGFHSADYCAWPVASLMQPAAGEAEPIPGMRP